MAVGQLTIDLDAIVDNWRALNALSGDDVETSAVIKADAYGLGADQVGLALKDVGVKTFFVAAVEEGVFLRRAIGPMAEIFVFSGHMDGDEGAIDASALTPLVNSIEQLTRQIETLPGRPFGVQLDTGMNRLGMEEGEWNAVREIVGAANPSLLMSHLACADEPDHEMNTHQLENFRQMTDDFDARRSLAATGGILMGADYHFDMTRPGVGLYGGLPFMDASHVVRLSLPVIQVRTVQPGETVGYACAWAPDAPAEIATVAAGYADGLIRAMGQNARVFAGRTPCPVVGRVSMDMLTIDVTNLEEVPNSLDIICPDQSVDQLAEAAGTIGYEILTSLGYRYSRRHISGGEE